MCKFEFGHDITSPSTISTLCVPKKLNWGHQIDVSVQNWKLQWACEQDVGATSNTWFNVCLLWCRNYTVETREKVSQKNGLTENLISMYLERCCKDNLSIVCFLCH